LYRKRKTDLSISFISFSVKKKYHERASNKPERAIFPILAIPKKARSRRLRQGVEVFLPIYSITTDFEREGARSARGRSRLDSKLVRLPKRRKKLNSKERNSATM
jgi:hypothetical protein